MADPIPPRPASPAPPGELRLEALCPVFRAFFPFDARLELDGLVQHIAPSCQLPLTKLVKSARASLVGIQIDRLTQDLREGASIYQVARRWKAITDQLMPLATSPHLLDPLGKKARTLFEVALLQDTSNAVPLELVEEECALFAMGQAKQGSLVSCRAMEKHFLLTKHQIAEVVHAYLQVVPRNALPSTLIDIIKTGYAHPSLWIAAYVPKLTPSERTAVFDAMLDSAPFALCTVVEGDSVFTYAQRLAQDPHSHLPAHIQGFGLTEVQIATLLPTLVAMQPGMLYLHREHFSTLRVHDWGTLLFFQDLENRIRDKSLPVALSTLQEMSKTYAIPAALVEPLFDRIDALVTDAESALALVRELNAHPTPYTYAAVARVLQKAQLEWFEPFVDITQSNGEERMLLKVDGMELFLDLVDLPDDLWRPPILHPSQLPAHLEEFRTDHSHTKAAFILQWDEELISGHYTLVYCEKGADGLHCFVSDSLGKEAHYMDELNAIVSEQSFASYTVYPHYRQNADHGCSVYVLADLFTLLETQDVFSTPEPPNFLKLLQSVSTLDAWDEPLAFTPCAYPLFASDAQDWGAFRAESVFYQGAVERNLYPQLRTPLIVETLLTHLVEGTS